MGTSAGKAGKKASASVCIYLSVSEGQDVPGEVIERAVLLTLETEGVAEGELSLTFLPDGPIREMNEEWLGHDWVPDVLAFALHDVGSSPVGDIYVGVEQAERQAIELGISLHEELVRLAVHGTLHVLGLDHDEGPATTDGELYRKQETVVDSLLKCEGAGLKAPSGTTGGGEGA